MTDDLALTAAPNLEGALAPLPSSAPLDRNPAAVYLATIPSKESQRTMATALETLAGLLSGGKATAGGSLAPSTTPTRPPCARP